MTRRQDTAEFKRDAIRLLATGMPVAEVAQAVDMPPMTLWGWYYAAKTEGCWRRGPRPPPPARHRIRRSRSPSPGGSGSWSSGWQSWSRSGSSWEKSRPSSPNSVRRRRALRAHGGGGDIAAPAGHPALSAARSAPEWLLPPARPAGCAAHPSPAGAAGVGPRHRAPVLGPPPTPWPSSDAGVAAGRGLSLLAGPGRSPDAGPGAAGTPWPQTSPLPAAGTLAAPHRSYHQSLPGRRWPAGLCQCPARDPDRWAHHPGADGGRAGVSGDRPRSGHPAHPGLGARSPSPDSDLTRQALSHARDRQVLAPEAIFHSDRGTPYTSHDFQDHCTTLTVTQSMAYRRLLGQRGGRILLRHAQGGSVQTNRPTSQPPRRSRPGS